MGRLATEAAENGVEEVFNQAVTTGRVDVKSAVLGMVPGLGALDRKAKGGGGGGGGLTSAVGLNLVSVGGGGGGCKNGRPPRKHSFEPDTKVLMADGSSRPIEDVNVGDKVVATDPKTGKSAAEPVTELHRNTDRELSDVTVKDQNGKASVLNTTQNHPFWNETDKKWSEAKQGHCVLRLLLVTAVMRSCGRWFARRVARAMLVSPLVLWNPIAVLRRVAITAGP